jgi:hypothetical protein
LRKIKREPWCGQHQPLTSGLLVLAAFFVRAAVTALALTALATLLAAGRFVILRVTTRRLLTAAALLTFARATLLALILIIVCHFDSSPFVD